MSDQREDLYEAQSVRAVAEAQRTPLEHGVHAVLCAIRDGGPMRARDILGMRGKVNITDMERRGLIVMRGVILEAPVYVYYLTQYGRLRLEADEAQYERHGHSVSVKRAPHAGMQVSAVQAELTREAFCVLCVLNHAGTLGLDDFLPHYRNPLAAMIGQGYAEQISTSSGMIYRVTAAGRTRMLDSIKPDSPPAPAFDDVLFHAAAERLRWVDGVGSHKHGVKPADWPTGELQHAVYPNGPHGGAVAALVDGPTGAAGPVGYDWTTGQNGAKPALRLRLYADGEMVIDHPDRPLTVREIEPVRTIALDGALASGLSLFLSSIDTGKQ